MPKGWAINVRIVDRSGNPVAGASVCIHSAPTDIPDLAAVTRADGVVNFSVPTEGSYGLTVNASGFHPTKEYMEASVDDSYLDVLIQDA